MRRLKGLCLRCQCRRCPQIMFWGRDRSAHDCMQKIESKQCLADSIEKQIGLRPTPLTWPVGVAGDFRGVLDRRRRSGIDKLGTGTLGPLRQGHGQQQGETPIG